jgi:hypothetical protein
MIIKRKTLQTTASGTALKIKTARRHGLRNCRKARITETAPIETRLRSPLQAAATS